MTAIQDTKVLLEMLRRSNLHLHAMTASLDLPWKPDALTEGDPRRLHNMYVHSLVACYVSKMADLSDGILHAEQSSNFLLYALSGRALIETTAALRWHMLTQYKPLLDTGISDLQGMQRLIDIDDRHLKGTRFNWESFLRKDYAKVLEEEKIALAAKIRKSAVPLYQDRPASAVNIVTCIENWAREEPAITMVYSLFCDLVHPNVGSSFLVASSTADGLFFTRSRGESFGRSIFEQSLPMLLSTAHQPFGPLLEMLMCTIWQDDEL